MSDLPPPPVPSGPTLAESSDTQASWWRRRLWKLPVWAWIIIGLIVIAAAAGAGAEDEDLEEARPSDTTMDTTNDTEPAEIVPATDAQAETPDPTSAAEVAIPERQAPDCPEIDDANWQAVDDALVEDLTLAVATAGVDPDGVQYIVGSIYDPTGNRVSSADTWAIVDGELAALSGSANEYSAGLPDARDILTGPGQGFDSDVRASLEDCAIDALRG